ncbi:hypothetical protein TNCV_802431 [Trichonephila clavipes]|nr:hypothetical protein TNCV_802431 [Trichonephila clavipes]
MTRSNSASVVDFLIESETRRLSLSWIEEYTDDIGIVAVRQGNSGASDVQQCSGKPREVFVGLPPVKP